MYEVSIRFYKKRIVNLLQKITFYRFCIYLFTCVKYFINDVKCDKKFETLLVKLLQFVERCIKMKMIVFKSE